MITLRLLSQVLLQHLVTKIFGKPCAAILTTFKNSEVTVTTAWSGDDLKIVIKKIKGQVSGDRTPLQKKQIWTPGSRESGVVVKPKIISNPIVKQ